MRRLREHQIVTLELSDEPPASIRCLVLAVEGDQAMLEPVVEDHVRLLSMDGRNALLTFEFRRQLISLRGRARRDDFDKGLLFAVTDSVLVPQRRRHARVEVALPISITPLVGENGTPGTPLDSRTRDVSADGMLVEVLLPTDVPRLQIVAHVPDNGPPISCEARIVRHVRGGTALRFTAIAATDRERLKQFVAIRKRMILEQVRNRAH